ncbi:MAG: carboxymuconolactone decarboxylase family protein [Sedimentisphaerales bacterium]|nr:carboxymuconolactone decarboxylase family protein [Sedimentisphaerales bacterium]
MDKTREYFAKFKADMDKMKAEIPDTVQGFGGLFAKVMKDGALTAREKELIALGIGVAIHCPPCISGHVQNCLDAGATRQQILEAASVAVVMAGGPAYVYIPVVLDTLDDLQKAGSDKS